MKRTIFSALFLLPILIGAVACNSPKESISEKTQMVKANTPQQFEEGVLVFKVKDSIKGDLPAYRREEVQLGEYPHLGSILDTYRVVSIAPFTPDEKENPAGKFYKIHFDDTLSAEDLRNALQQIDIIEYAEKVPVNDPNAN